MTLSDLASIGSFISGVAVVFSFIFLAMQMRQANKNQRALMQQGRSTKIITVTLRQADADMRDIVMRAIQADSSLTSAETQAFLCFAAALFWTMEDSYLRYQSGLLDTASWETDASTLRGFLSLPAYQAAWVFNRAMISGSYRDYVDALARDVKMVKSYDIAAFWNSLMAEKMALAA